MSIDIGGLAEKIALGKVILGRLKEVKGLVKTCAKGQDVVVPVIRGVRIFGRKGEIHSARFTPTED